MEYLKPGSVLELGPAQGVGTAILAKKIKDLEVVDASSKYIEQTRNSLPEVKCHLSLFENFKTPNRFDNVILGNVLEHVESPEQIVSKFSKWLKPQGRIIVSVPNANSIHREICVAMDMLKSKKRT